MGLQRILAQVQSFTKISQSGNALSDGSKQANELALRIGVSLVLSGRSCARGRGHGHRRGRERGQSTRGRSSILHDCA